MTDTAQIRASELYSAQREKLNKNTDRLFGILMPVQWVGAIIWAVAATPASWTGTDSFIHPHVWAAVVLGALITIPASLLAIFWSGSPVTRYSISVCQMLMSGLLIHVSGGRIETHFHIFGSLAFLAFYRDWRMLVPATLAVAADHLLRGIFIPWSIYGSINGASWRFVEHSGWVLFEDVVLLVAIARGVSEMKAIAERQALLEEANANTEATVLERTKELRESEERFRAFSEQAVDAFFVFDRDGEILTVNEQASKDLGYGREQLLRMNLCQLEASAEGVSPLSDMLRAMPEDSLTIEAQLRRQDGSVFPVEVRAGQLRLDGERRVLALARDVTERKRADQAQRAKEEAERANQAKNKFLSRMSHELRTPLNAVIGFAQLLDTPEPNDRQAEYATYIHQAGTHLLKLINEVLEISKIESGNISISTETFHADEVIRSAIDLTMPLATEREIKIDMVPGEGERILVHADRQRLYQVAINLLSNAVKYNRPGGSVTITMERLEQGRALLSFTDTGIGIAEDMACRVFTPFDRLGADQNVSTEGTGLGLSLSKNLVEAMGGTLTFKSTVGVGSTFCVDLETATQSQLLAA